jgi:putative peptidoglycan lipid II flippase
MFFPKMSRRFAENDIEGATAICSNMLSAITAIIIPIMVFVGACSEPIIKLLYQRGKFTAEDTINVAVLLAIYSVGMIALSWQDIFNKYFYSMQKSVVPMISAIAGITANVTLSFALIPSIGLKGLAIATVVSGFLMVFVLALCSLKVTKKIFTKSFCKEILKIGVAGAVSLISCKILMSVLNFNCSVILQIVFIVLIFAVSLIMYVLTMLIVKSENITGLKNVIKTGEGTADV